MRKLLMIMMYSFAPVVLAGDYPLGIEIPIGGLSLSNLEINQAVEKTLSRYGWIYTNKSDTHITATVHGGTPLDVRFSEGQKVTFTYQDEYDEHKLFNRLRNLRKTATVNLSDCTIKSASAPDTATNLRRSIVYALAKSNWIIKKSSDNDIVARSIPNGRIEVKFTPDGTFSMKRWDELEEVYTDPLQDRYIQKVKSTLEGQQVRCSH